MRSGGILMPVFSLPSDYGIGTFGKCACEFIDFVQKSGFRYWQILPLNPTNWSNSPYQSFSDAALNPYYIDLDSLRDDGLLKEEDYKYEDFGNRPDTVDYEKLYTNRYKVLEKAYSNFKAGEDIDYKLFCEEQSDWLEDYALFMVLKNVYEGLNWREWPENIKYRDAAALTTLRNEYGKEIDFYKFIQYECYKQWNKLKKYANEKNIKIIGDIPIYTADDSADVWAHPEQFMLDKELLPKLVAGCPPDAFSEEGQLWGSPVYNWEDMSAEEEPYSWWRRRMKRALKVYDVVRIDHFRGLESFYCIKYGSKDAKCGEWRKGPGMELLNYIEKDYGQKAPIIAEDLGFLTDEVKKLLKESGYPGMKILQFAFDAGMNSDYIPHNHIKNCVVYTGTHDNDTIIGWTGSADKEDVKRAYRYLHYEGQEGFNWTMMRQALMSVADTVVLTLPDLLGLDSSGRINTPSTVGDNWNWRVTKGCTNDWLAHIIYDYMKLYGRTEK